ncbi:MAG: hypothetical protein ACKVS6_05205 [Planctomycetota bacterium]
MQHPFPEAAMIAFLLCLLQAATAATPEIRVEFYNISSNSVSVDLTIEATALPKVAPTDGSAAPKKVTRFFTWQTATGTASDNGELAGLVSRAMTEGGIDVTADGSEAIFKNTSEVTIKASRWDSLGAQIWSAVPKEKAQDKQTAVYTFLFDPNGKAGKAALVFGGGAKVGRPKPAEGDDSASVELPRDPKTNDKTKNPPKPAGGAKPNDPKSKVKPSELKIGIAPDSDAKAIKATATKLASDLGWKVEGDSDTKYKFRNVSDGAPLWAFVRFAGQGQATIGMRVDMEAKEAPNAKKPEKGQK